MNGHDARIWGFQGAYFLGWAADCRTCRWMGTRHERLEGARRDLEQHVRQEDASDEQPERA
jgi:hypothetical protein